MVIKKDAVSFRVALLGGPFSRVPMYGTALAFMEELYAALQSCIAKESKEWSYALHNAGTSTEPSL